jgi:hypothetical protein
MMASGKSMAMLLPIRAKGHGELGPFAHAAFLKKVLHLIAAQTEAFAPQSIEMFSFSSGIFGLNAPLPGMRGNLAAVYNIDPTGGTAAGVHGIKAWQVLSGFTTHGKGRAGFEFLSENRWAHEDKFSVRNDKSVFPWASPADISTITSCRTTACISAWWPSELRVRLNGGEPSPACRRLAANAQRALSPQGCAMIR